MKFCIREIRKMRNMTQEELAKRAGVARTVLSSLEKEPDPEEDLQKWWLGGVFDFLLDLVIQPWFTNLRIR